MTKVTHPLELSTTLFPIGVFICAAGMNVLDTHCCYDVKGLISTVYKLLQELSLFSCMPNEQLLHLHACLFLLCCSVRVPVCSSGSVSAATFKADSQLSIFWKDQ